MNSQSFLELVKSGNTQAVVSVIDAGEVNLRQFEQSTMREPSFLIAAIRKRDLAMTRCLLEHGANPEAISYAEIDVPGTTPYTYAGKFFLDDFIQLMTPYLGTVPRDEKIEKQRYLEYYFWD